MARERDEFRRCAPGYGAIVVVCAPVLWRSVQSTSTFETPRLIAWWIVVVLFTTTFTLIVTRELQRKIFIALLVAQSILALLANWLIPMGIPGVALTGILLALAAATFARLPRSIAMGAIVTQTAVLFAIYYGPSEWPFGVALSASAAYGLMQFILESTWRLATLERRRRVELEGTLRELRSTQAMLTETVRATQRMEIARNLHDVVGHHLVALGLQLDAAIDAPSDVAQRERLTSSRQLTRLLLGEVRAVVAGMNEEGVVELREALGKLSTEGPGPRVHVHVAPDAPRMTSDMAELLLRCAQEAVTNARKHAGATEITIELDNRALKIRDNGRGIGRAKQGFGLASMQARCTAEGCTLHILSSSSGTEIAVRWELEAPE